MENETKFKGSKTVSMFNKASSAWEDVPRETVGQLFQTGNYGIDPDAEIDLVSPNGKRGTTQGKDLEALLAKGFNLESYEKTKEEFLKDEYGNSPVSAGALGVARGLSFGLSDQLAKKAGVSEEFLRENQKRNKGAAIAGEVAGVAAPLLLSGGTAAPAVAGAKAAQGASLAAKATRAAGVLPRAVAKLGIGAEKKAAQAVTKMIAEKLAVSGATKGAAKSVARLIAEKALPKAAGSAVEGAFYGAGHLISEEALGNVELNAETVLSTVGVGTLLGGAIGGAVGVGGVAFNKLGSKAANKIFKPIEDELDDIKRLTDDVRPFTTEEKVTAKKLADVTPDELRYYRNNKQRIKEQPSMDELPAMYEDGVEQLQTMMNQSETAAVEAIERSNAQMTTKELDDLIVNKIDNLKNEPSTESTQSAVKRLQSYRDGNIPRDIEGKIIDKTWDGPRIRKFIQGLRKDIKNAYQKNEISLKDEIVKDLVDVDLNTLLRDRVDGLTEIMQPYSKMVQTFKGLQKLEGRGGTNWFDQRFIKTMERNYNGFNTGALKGAAKNKSTWEKTVRDFQDLTGIKFQEIYNDRKVLSRLFPDKAVGREVGSAFENMGRAARQSLRNPSGAIQDTMFGTVMGMLGKVGTGVKRQAIEGGSSSIGKLVNKYASLEKIIKQQRSTVKGYVSDLLTTGAKTQAFRNVSTSMLMDMSFSPYKKNTAENRKDAYKERAKEIKELVNNPSLLVELMGANMKSMQQYAPKMASHATQQVSTAVNFLAQKLPDPPVHDSLFADQDDYTPSDEQVASFERYVEAVQDPLSVLEKAQTNELTDEYIEAIEVVYPNLYQEMQTQMLESMAELKEKISYQKKIQLGILFKTPTDVTMSVGFLKMLTSLSASQESEAEPLAGAKSLNIANRSQTKMDYLEGRAS